MSTTAAAGSPRGALRSRAIENADAKRIEPVVYWAGLGAIMVGFMIYIMFQWITGPHFAPVPPGPTAQPDWMYPAQVIFQAALVVATLILGWRLVLRPWFRERRLTTDGAFFVAFLTMYFQDQFTNAGGYWFSYNAHVFNMGSWFPELPWWSSFAAPGATAPEPIFMMATGYIYFFVASMFLGMFLLRKCKERWPSLSMPALFSIVFLAMMGVDIFIEVFIWLPLGFYSYLWAPGPIINAGAVNQFPLIEAAMVGVLSTTIVALRYFTDDKGNTVVERGLDKVTASPGKKALLRLLAVIAGIQFLFFYVYNVPMYGVGLHSKDWPEAVQARSYMLNNLCGSGTDRACPTKDMPKIVDTETAIRITPQGELLIPEGASFPQPVPFWEKAESHLEFGPVRH